MEKPQIFKKQELIKVSKLAGLWCCSRQHIYNLIDQGLLPAFRFGGKRCMCVPLAAVEDYKKLALVDPSK